ncbi:putative TetR family transcriptional regulator [Actinacidiphila reveromycinica]|uniref:Putative TetR family transcriptional regulator n=1 Tax=Actinacidiphila reveromycinica TaxID=659352 RepID=A0A7U3VN38_9ACTN|nr:TetR/AcrR family transcriptional regulator [Streptomyces sp. SN-593]BBA97174.1 putative TetR family transcriptional regulator [Streptomyces sp. SN-593]
MTQGAEGGGAATLWDRTRQLAAQEILRTALRLFAQQGYDETTVAQIAREAGVSQRTLFRYFGTKEDLLGSGEEQFVTLLTEAVRAQPADADVWQVLRAGFEAVLSLHTSPGEALERFRLVHRTDSLRAAYLGKRVRLQEAVLPLLEARLAPSGIGRGQARAIVATAFACFDAATVTWLEDDGRGDVLDLYDRGLAALGNTGTALRPDPGHRGDPPDRP